MRVPHSPSQPIAQPPLTTFAGALARQLPVPNIQVLAHARERLGAVLHPGTCKRGASLLLQCEAPSHLMVLRPVGRGRCGHVLLAATESGKIVAAKISRDATLLAREASVGALVQEAVRRSSPHASQLFCFPLELHVFDDGACLLQQPAHPLSLQRLTEILHSGAMPMRESLRALDLELFGLWLAVQLLEAIHVLHNVAGVLHCDLRPDNLALRAASPQSITTVLQRLADRGSHCFAAAEEEPVFGLAVLDFGRSLPLSQCLENGHALVGAPLEAMHACVAMRRGAGWLFDADLFAAASALHSLLFGSALRLRPARSLDLPPDNIAQLQATLMAAMGHDGRSFLPSATRKRAWRYPGWPVLWALLINWPGGTAGAAPLELLLRDAASFLLDSSRDFGDALRSVSRAIASVAGSSRVR